MRQARKEVRPYRTSSARHHGSARHVTKPRRLQLVVPGVDARQARSQAGAIGLQRHGTAQYRDKLIEFRKIEIAVLKP